MSYLVLVRHGTSEWNTKGLWTGWRDIKLDENGEKQAEDMAKLIQDIPLDLFYTSKLVRAIKTAQIIEKTLSLNLPIKQDTALNERNYGIYTGLNKWQLKEKVGEKEFQKIRRGWDYPLPEGESLKDVYDRVVPYFQKEILPHLKDGKNVLITSHGNTLRALTKYLCSLSADEVCNLEIGFGEVYIYQFNSIGNVVGQELRSENSGKGKI